MEWQFERKLTFTVTSKWQGWFCKRCCWNRPQPSRIEDRSALAAVIDEEFRAHDCAEFAAANWLHQENAQTGVS